MKKIYALFAAALMSVSLFATPETVPTTQDLAAKYDVANAVVLCCYFDVAPCNPIVVTGEYGSISWGYNIAELAAFEPVVGFDGWYAVEVPFTAGKTVNLRPIQLTGEDGNYAFDWDYGAGGPDAWTNMGGKQGTVSGSGFGDEGTLACTEAGAYIYEIARWKGDKTPCVALIKHNYTLVLFPPYCEKNDEYFVPAVAGKPFNNWDGFQPLAMIEYEGRDAYGIVVEAAEGWDYKFSDMTFGFDNQYQWLKADDESWQNWDNFIFPEATKDTTLVYDWSNNDSNRYAMCDADIYTVELSAKLPAGAPEAGVEVVGTFVGASWNEGVEMEYDAVEAAYTATITAIEASQFKFRELGTWNNQIQYFEDEEWKDADNFKVGEEWEFNTETLTATIELDLSDPTEYKWTLSDTEEPEYTVLYANLPAANSPEAVNIVVDGEGTAMEHLDNGWWLVKFDAKASQAFTFSSADGSVVVEKYNAADGAWAPLANELVFGELWQDDTDKGTPCKWIELSLDDAALYRWAAAPEGIENIVLTEKAQKVVVDGAVYIIRDNKMFNIHGAQVR